MTDWLHYQYEIIYDWIWKRIWAICPLCEGSYWFPDWPYRERCDFCGGNEYVFSLRKWKYDLIDWYWANIGTHLFHWRLDHLYKTCPCCEGSYPWPDVGSFIECPVCNRWGYVWWITWRLWDNPRQWINENTHD